MYLYNDLASTSIIHAKKWCVWLAERDYIMKTYLLSCQPRVTVTSCFVDKAIRDFDR